MPLPESSERFSIRKKAKALGGDLLSVFSSHKRSSSISRQSDAKKSSMIPLGIASASAPSLPAPEAANVPPVTDRASQNEPTRPASTAPSPGGLLRECFVH